MNCNYRRALSGIVLVGLLLSFVSCKTPPSPESPLFPGPGTQEPVTIIASLRFVSIEAHDTSLIKVNYILRVENPGPTEAPVIIDKWSIMVNNTATNIAPVFSINKTAGVYAFAVTGTEGQQAAMEIPLSLELDIPSLIAAGVPLTDDFTVELALDLIHVNMQLVPVSIRVSETAVFPFVREPIFTITAIAILKAELINTRFRVSMKIDNPNHFPVVLSAFKYELYGDGQSWASGTDRNPLNIPAKTSVVVNLFLLMNFIDMSRSLLDQIIRLEHVNYRFNGEAFVSTGVDYLPGFISKFDLSGYSEVLDN
jgi:LEA14-like dessication related protein